MSKKNGSHLFNNKPSCNHATDLDPCRKLVACVSCDMVSVSVSLFPYHLHRCLVSDLQQNITKQTNHTYIRISFDNSPTTAPPAYLRVNPARLVTSFLGLQIFSFLFLSCLLSHLLIPMQCPSAPCRHARSKIHPFTSPFLPSLPQISRFCRNL